MSDDREKRKKRRARKAQSHRAAVHRELRDPKYRQRVVEKKVKKPTKRELLEAAQEDGLEWLLKASSDLSDPS